MCLWERKGRGVVSVGCWERALGDAEQWLLVVGRCVVTVLGLLSPIAGMAKAHAHARNGTRGEEAARGEAKGQQHAKPRACKRLRVSVEKYDLHPLRDRGTQPRASQEQKVQGRKDPKCSVPWAWQLCCREVESCEVGHGGGGEAMIEGDDALTSVVSRAKEAASYTHKQAKKRS